jgi:glycine cleavage system regulatory protein
MVGDDRKKIRALFNRLMATKHIKFPVSDMDFKLQKAPTDAKEAIVAVFTITNPQSAEATALIEEFGGTMTEQNGQCIFTLKIVQGKKDEDDPNQTKIPGTEARDPDEEDKD